MPQHVEHGLGQLGTFVEQLVVQAGKFAGLDHAGRRGSRETPAALGIDQMVIPVGRDVKLEIQVEALTE